MDSMSSNQSIEYIYNEFPEPDEIIALYKSSGINRPVEEHERILKMYIHSNLVVTARLNGTLVGIARALTDYCYCCYLSDLAVHGDYQRQGIGRMLLTKVRDFIGPESMLLLLSAPGALEYYPKVGFEKVTNGYIIQRSQ